MKKNIVLVIVVAMAAFGIFVATKFSQNNTTIRENDSAGTEAKQELTNPASEIGEGEVRLTEDNFTAEIKEYKGVAIVDMFSPSCPYCQQIGPVISEIAKENQGKYKVGKLNVFLAPEIANEFQIQSYPILIIFKDGQEVTRLVGAKPKAEILSALEEVSK